MGVSTSTMPGTPIRIYRLSTVYLPYINRICTVIYSGERGFFDGSSTN